MSESESRSVEDEQVRPDKSDEILNNSLKKDETLDSLVRRDDGQLHSSTVDETSKQLEPSTKDKFTKSELNERTTGALDDSRTSSSGTLESRTTPERNGDGRIPSGYEIKCDPHTGEEFYVNIFTGKPFNI